MPTRRLLLTLIALLAAVIVAGVAGVAGLAYWRLSATPPSGELLVVRDQRILLIAADGSERVLVEDASATGYRFPTLAPGGERVAYVAEDEQGEVALFSVELSTGQRTELYSSPDAPPLYLLWSPDGRSVSFLGTQRLGGLGVYVVAADGSSQAELLGITPGSSYFAWQPDSSTLLLHNGGSRFEQGTVANQRLGAPEVLYELADPGFFRAPAWSRDGSQFYYVAQPAISEPSSPDAIESTLTRVGADGSSPQVLATEKRAAMFFARAPASEHLAYVTGSLDGASFGALKVVDAANGNVTLVSRPDERVPAFFWSPDGQQLAYLTYSVGNNQTLSLTWHLVGRDGGEIRDLASFTPSQTFVQLLSYFDAYASALDLWSPDGRELVYSTDEGIALLDLTSGEVSQRGAGQLAMWLHRE